MLLFIYLYYKICDCGRGAASSYMRKAGETHGTVRIQISIGKSNKVHCFFPPFGDCLEFISLVIILFTCTIAFVFLLTGNGPGHGQAWGCDLSYDYVKINAEYTS